MKAMNRREMIVGTVASAALIPLVGIEPAKASITKLTLFSDDLINDCRTLGYIPEFFTAEKRKVFYGNGDLPRYGGYETTWQRERLRHVDPINFESWVRNMNPGHTTFIIERKDYAPPSECVTYGCQLQMRIYDQGKYVATIIKFERTYKEHYRVITTSNSPPDLTYGWKKVVR